MLTDADTNLIGYGQVRYLEQTGKTMEQMLVKSDPWAGDCRREDCFPCTTGDMGKCTKQGVNYKIECITCKEEGKAVSYIGESAPTMCDRGAEHLDAW